MLINMIHLGDVKMDIILMVKSALKYLIMHIRMATFSYVMKVMIKLGINV